MTRMIRILTVLLSHWRRHPIQLATLLIGLISATALWSGVQALNAQARSSYDRAAATFGGARTAMLVGRTTTFPQKLFVDLRRAGWPVSPVLEGRIQIGGRSLRLLGIEPITLPAEVGNAPTIGRANLQSFMTPPGQTLVAPEMLADLNLTEGATPTANGGITAAVAVQAQLVPGVLVVDIGVAQRPSTCRIRLHGCWSARPKASARRSKVLRATNCAWSRRMPRAISNASPTAFIST
jgi:putative ABC transport system permease protein